MRVIGGIAAGRLLKVPKGYAVRPTPDLVKQAVFNSLGACVAGARVLELFGGSGALGLECLSRGAESLTVIEKARKHANLIRANLNAANLPGDRFQLRLQDVFTAIPQLHEADREFDLIFADPPFGAKTAGCRSVSCSQKLLDEVLLPELLAEDGLLILGHARRDEVTVTEAWEESKALKHGDSIMLFLRKSVL